MKHKILLIVLSLSLLFSCNGKMAFDTEKWQAVNSRDIDRGKKSVRQRMLPNVIKLIDGKTRAEVVRLLGEGEDTEYFQTTGRDSIYLLGPEDSYISIDSEWLLLWFDDEQKLERYEIVTD